MITIAIIGAGVMARNIAIRAKELNIKSICFAWSNGAVAKDYVDTFYDISIFDTGKIIEICKKEKINGVLATTELTVKIAGIVAEELGLNGNPSFIYQNITNKGYVRSKLKNSNWIGLQPTFQLMTDKKEPIIAKYPVVVKPVSFGGKRGLSVVHNKKELNEALDYAWETIGDRNSDGLIIEEFLNGGKEYSVETLSFNGKHHVIQITQKDSSGAPHCVELGHHQPAELAQEVWDKVVNTIKNLLEIMEIQNGPCHIEIKIIENKIYLIEINARPGGDFITYPLTELSSGYKYLTGIILTACDIYYNPDFYSGKKQFAGVYFVTKQTEFLKNIFEQCDNKPWLYKKNKVSDELQEISHNDCYHINSFIYCSENKPCILGE